MARVIQDSDDEDVVDSALQPDVTTITKRDKDLAPTEEQPSAVQSTSSTGIEDGCHLVDHVC